ncbi:PREDICTED: putative MO25-like protein At5g47540 isoform X2 [Lupinus angustifolius]|uniref:putative MO25-like protein At5g47540 isoform X2 n=1 Tax=Lupinus angustifolius TaxID=3871 RepID=UPI00092EF8E7|nr:PREDICTED: putative MO25-like protein At5g47540 isoform X2 [Lupinus angustifolius]
MKKDVMKGLFKHKTRSPVELVHHAHQLLLFLDTNTSSRENKREEKLSELSKTILEIRTILYGNGASEPNPDACSQLTREFFKEDTFRLLIISLPNLKLGPRQDATHVIANLQRQRVNSKLIASHYLENNIDLVDILMQGYEKEGDVALTYGAVARECIRHQSVARHVLESEHMKKFFEYVQIPNFEVASDAGATFKELLTRHKSTVAEFLSKNYDWFFKEYNSLLESTSYFTRRRAVKLLGDMLLDRSNSAVMVRYVSSLDNMVILMNLLRDSNKTIQFETFNVFKLFVANQNKPPEVISILVTNKSKLLQFLSNFNSEKDEQFQADRRQVISEIITVGQEDRPCTSSDDCEVQC